MKASDRSTRNRAASGWRGIWLTVLMLPVLAACQAQKPVSRGVKLVELNQLDPGIRLDIRYATNNNFTGRPLYPEARAFLLPEPARALLRVHQSLRKQGYGLLIYDAYRPWSVTLSLWNSASDADRRNGYVADPVVGSRHNRACAVDLGLYDLQSGKPVDMPSSFDDFSERAHADWQGGNPMARRNRDTLRRAMAAQGFAVLHNEWWHFNYRDCDRQPLLDIPFDSIQ